jgi:acyl-CoA thioester hydrolase
VRYPETDRMGVAHHSHFLVWFELGRTELMRATGCSYRDLEDREGIFFPVVEVQARYRAPARYDDVLDISTRMVLASGARVRFEYTISRADDGSPVATGFTEHASIGRSGRPTRLPDSVLARFAGGGPGNR